MSLKNDDGGAMTDDAASSMIGMVLKREEGENPTQGNDNDGPKPHHWMTTMRVADDSEDDAEEEKAEADNKQVHKDQSVRDVDAGTTRKVAVRPSTALKRDASSIHDVQRTSKSSTRSFAGHRVASSSENRPEAQADQVENRPAADTSNKPLGASQRTSAEVGLQTPEETARPPAVVTEGHSNPGGAEQVDPNHPLAPSDQAPPPANDGNSLTPPPQDPNPSNDGHFSSEDHVRTTFFEITKAAVASDLVVMLLVAGAVLHSTPGWQTAAILLTLAHGVLLDMDEKLLPSQLFPLAIQAAHRVSSKSPSPQKGRFSIGKGVIMIVYFFWALFTKPDTGSFNKSNTSQRPKLSSCSSIVASCSSAFWSVLLAEEDGANAAQQPAQTSSSTQQRPRRYALMMFLLLIYFIFFIARWTSYMIVTVLLYTWDEETLSTEFDENNLLLLEVARVTHIIALFCLGAYFLFFAMPRLMWKLLIGDRKDPEYERELFCCGLKCARLSKKETNKKKEIRCRDSVKLVIAGLIVFVIFPLATMAFLGANVALAVITGTTYEASLHVSRMTDKGTMADFNQTVYFNQTTTMSPTTILSTLSPSETTINTLSPAPFSSLRGHDLMMTIVDHQDDAALLSARPPPVQVFNEKIFYELPGPETFQNANESCHLLNGTLATLGNIDQVAAAVLASTPSTTVWIGLNDLVQEGLYTWSDDETINVNLSTLGYPVDTGGRAEDNDCGVLITEGNQTTIRLQSCGSAIRPLCQFSTSWRPVPKEYSTTSCNTSLYLVGLILYPVILCFLFAVVILIGTLRWMGVTCGNIGETCVRIQGIALLLATVWGSITLLIWGPTVTLLSALDRPANGDTNLVDCPDSFRDTIENLAHIAWVLGYSAFFGIVGIVWIANQIRFTEPIKSTPAGNVRVPPNSPTRGDRMSRLAWYIIAAFYQPFAGIGPKGCCPESCM